MVLEINDAEAHSPRVARKRRARMQSILAAALEVAREEGRDALTLQRVAERLDVTPAALYRYFASKDALVAELQRSVITWLAEETRGRIDAAASFARDTELETGERALLNVLVTALTFEHFARTAPVEFGLLSMHLSAPEFALPEREALQVFRAAWSSLEDLAGHIETAAAHGALSSGEARDRALALWAGLQGVVQTRKLARSAAGRIDPTRIALGLVTSLLEGWGADPAMVSRLMDDARSRGFAEPAASLGELLEAAGG
jgi:AcrR family transcriptional regulator